MFFFQHQGLPTKQTGLLWILREPPRAADVILVQVQTAIRLPEALEASVASSERENVGTVVFKRREIYVIIPGAILG